MNSKDGENLAIETIGSHVMVAKQFKNDLPNLWYAMARTAPWADEEIPPAEDMYTTTLDQIVGFKKFETAQLVVPLNQQSDGHQTDDTVFSYKGSDWQLVDDDDAIKEGARYVYLETTVNPDDLPSAVYRQVGVYRGLVPQPTASDKIVLKPTEVKDMGMLVGYDNRLFQRYADNITLKEQFVLKF